MSVRVGARKLAWIAVLGCVSLGLAVLQNWVLWGYWFSRPTLAEALEEGSVVRGFSMLDFRSGGVTQVPDRGTAAEAARRVCQPERNECREGRLVARAERVFGALEGVPQVDSTILATAWAELKGRGWLPQVRDPQYRESGVPKAGLALLFVKGNQDLLLLAYRTSEIANDRYAYSEVLQEIGPGEVRIIQQTRFFLDIAGLEGLEWPILWPLNFIVLSAIWVLTMRRRTWLPEERWGALAGALGALPILAYLNQNALSLRAYSIDDGGLLVMPLLNLFTVAVGVLIGRGLGRLTWHLRRRVST